MAGEEGSNGSSDDGGAPESVNPRLRPAPRARATAVGYAARHDLSVGGYIKVANELDPKEEDVGLQPSMIAPGVEEHRRLLRRDKLIQRGVLFSVLAVFGLGVAFIIRALLR